jgi:hypothetical protein
LPLGQHLQSEQVSQQEWSVAFTTTTTEPDSTTEDVAVWAASLTDQALATPAALVQPVGHQPASAPQLGPQLVLVEGGQRSVPQPERPLAAGIAAIGGPWAGQRPITDRASASRVALGCPVTRSVTNGIVGAGRGGHAATPVWSASGRVAPGGVCWSPASLTR